MNKDMIVMSTEDFADMQVREPPKRRHEITKCVVEYSLDGEYICTWNSARQAAMHYNMSVGLIGSICRGTCNYSNKTRSIFLYRGDDIAKRLRQIDGSLLKLSPHATKVKEIFEYSLNGRFLTKWPAGTIAANAYGITPHLIHNCCKGIRLFIDKKTFLYKDGDIKQRVKDIKAELYRLSKRRPKYREVDEYTLKGNFVKGYPSASAASRELGVPVSSITRCCNGWDKYNKNHLTCKNKIFLWIGDSISDRLEQIKQNRK